MRVKQLALEILLKILGFTFDQRPNANKHVELLIQRFYAKLWTIRFLKKSGMPQDKLLRVYYTLVRSAVEYCSVVYHTMIPKLLADKLESIQRQALRIIYGQNCNMEALFAAKGISTLYDRREEAVMNFALKNEKRPRYGGRWFEEYEETDRSVRGTTRDKYKLPRFRTERMRNNPVTRMTMALNKHYSN